MSGHSPDLTLNVASISTRQHGAAELLTATQQRLLRIGQTPHRTKSARTDAP